MIPYVFRLSLQNILLVQRQMSVKERDVEQFQQALKIYTEATCSQLNNLQYVHLSDSGCPRDLMQSLRLASPSPLCHQMMYNPVQPCLFLSLLHLFSTPFIFIFSISVQNLPDRSCFIMYEFWQDRLSWMR